MKNDVSSGYSSFRETDDGKDCESGCETNCDVANEMSYGMQNVSDCETEDGRTWTIDTAEGSSSVRSASPSSSPHHPQTVQWCSAPPSPTSAESAAAAMSRIPLPTGRHCAPSHPQ